MNNSFRYVPNQVYIEQPHTNAETHSRLRSQYLSSIESQTELTDYIHSELSNEPPLFLPEPYTDDEIDKLHSNMQDTLNRIVQCDNMFCPDLHTEHQRAIRLAIDIDSPQHMYKYYKCRYDTILKAGDPNDCEINLAHLIKQFTPSVNHAIERERLIQNGDVLDHYYGPHYNSHFWYQGAGDIWRKVSHNSRLINAESGCKELKDKFNQCILDTAQSDETCFALYSQSEICLPGINCRYLRRSLAECTSLYAYGDYDNFTQCIQRQANFEQCKERYVPPPKNIIVELSDIVGKSNVPLAQQHVRKMLHYYHKQYYDNVMNQFKRRALEIISINNPRDYTPTETIYLFKHKEIDLHQAEQNMDELNIKQYTHNPYDDIMFSDTITLQPESYLPTDEIEFQDMIARHDFIDAYMELKGISDKRDYMGDSLLKPLPWEDPDSADYLDPYVAQYGSEHEKRIAEALWVEKLHHEAKKRMEHKHLLQVTVEHDSSGKQSISETPINLPDGGSSPLLPPPHIYQNGIDGNVLITTIFNTDRRNPLERNVMVLPHETVDNLEKKVALQNAKDENNVLIGPNKLHPEHSHGGNPAAIEIHKPPPSNDTLPFVGLPPNNDIDDGSTPYPITKPIKTNTSIHDNITTDPNDPQVRARANLPDSTSYAQPNTTEFIPGARGTPYTGTSTHHGTYIDNGVYETLDDLRDRLVDGNNNDTIYDNNTKRSIINSPYLLHHTNTLEDKYSSMVRDKIRTTLLTRKFPRIKQILYYDAYYSTYFSYQPILNTSFPIFPLNHLYHYQDFDYDWVDPQGTLTSVPYIRIDTLGHNFSPSLFTRDIIRDYPVERLLTVSNNTTYDDDNKSSGIYLGYPQLDNMNYLNHYRMYFKDRDMYMTCYSNDTTCIPSRFPDDNYGTFKDIATSQTWFLRPDTFEYYAYTSDGDRIVYSIRDKTVKIWTINGRTYTPDDTIIQQVHNTMERQQQHWEHEAVDIMLDRTKREQRLAAKAQHGNEIITGPDIDNTQFDQRIPYTIHPFVSYRDNLDAFAYYKALKNKEKENNDMMLSYDPSIETHQRIKYRYRKKIKFFDPITNMTVHDSERLRDALLLSYHELKLLRHKYGSILAQEMPPRIQDKFDLKSKYNHSKEHFNYIKQLELDPHSSLMYETDPTNPLVRVYMDRHGLTDIQEYYNIVEYAREFQRELIDEYQLLEFNEMNTYQQFLADKAVSAAALKLTYTEKLVRLFKLYEKYGKTAPFLRQYNAPFGYIDNTYHYAEHLEPTFIKPDQLFELHSFEI